MRKLIYFLTLIPFIGFSQIQLPAASPSAVITQGVGLGTVTIDYSRPSAKGRKVFGNLVPYGKVWRTGANKITSISFSEKMKINGTEMDAKKYGLYTIPGVKSWKIILNNDSEQWGAYEYNSVQDALSFEVQPIELDHNVNEMTIAFEEFTPTSTYVVISWETTAVKFKIEHDVKKDILAAIETEMAKEKPEVASYFTSADYYFQNDYKLPQALDWAKRALAADEQYWTYQLVARIAAKMGKCDQAVPAAKASMKLAKEAGDDAYILLNQHSLMMCGVSE